MGEGKWRARWQAFRQPVTEEKTRVLKERWDSLPAELQTDNQIAGRHLTHCGFTLGASYCSFHCTHCYLPKNANSVPIPSFAQVKEQIDANRRLQGPGGGLQITGGDVADAYWRAGRPNELIEIMKYAYSVGSIPMLMTHGQTLIEQPEFLERLVVEGGLRQISVHVDMTQAGRHGYPIGRIKCEADLHPVRQAFTDLAAAIREKTGANLEYALSFTVTRKNIDDVPEVLRWYLADPERTHIWRMISFQPEADTGRTIFSRTPDHLGGCLGENLRRRWPAAAAAMFPSSGIPIATAGPRSWSRGRRGKFSRSCPTIKSSTPCLAKCCGKSAASRWSTMMPGRRRFDWRACSRSIPFWR